MLMQSIRSQSDQDAELVCTDPSTGEVIGHAALTSSLEVQAAVKRAREAQPAWASQSFKDRGRVILKAREIVLAEIEEIGRLIASETGKPVDEALSMEIVPSLDLMFYFAHHTQKLLKPQKKIGIGHYGLMGRSSSLVYQPLGVIGIISPWNFPWATPLDEVVLALMAGNSVVVKPSELTSLTALKIGDIFTRAGLPTGLLAILTGDASTGAALSDAGVDKIIFTGSVATGKRVAETAARRLTPVVLELGGKDPMIVLADANIENAARAAVWGAFANSGQACASVERCYVHESIAAEFISRVVVETKALKQGSPLERETDVGSMTSERQLSIVEDHIADALGSGANILIGGSRVSGKGWYHEPTVLTNVNHNMKIMREETFGPTLPIMTFKSETEALALANDSVYGLTASLFTSDISRGRRLAEQIQAGTVMINDV
jgi:acyl-CoA reductase-like NAD-dependent aldehyde dehydrogenase